MRLFYVKFRTRFVFCVTTKWVSCVRWQQRLMPYWSTGATVTAREAIGRTMCIVCDNIVFDDPFASMCVCVYVDYTSMCMCVFVCLYRFCTLLCILSRHCAGLQLFNSNKYLNRCSVLNSQVLYKWFFLAKGKIYGNCCSEVFCLKNEERFFLVDWKMLLNLKSKVNWFCIHSANVTHVRRSWTEKDCWYQQREAEFHTEFGLTIFFVVVWNCLRCVLLSLHNFWCTYNAMPIWYFRKYQNKILDLILFYEFILNLSQNYWIFHG